MPPVISGMHYGPVRPHAQYSPWLDDEEFLSQYRQIQDHTFVDMYRCFELWQLVAQTSSIEGAILEVGVWRGGTGALIATRAEHLGLAKPVYLCDTFKGVVKAGQEDSAYCGGEHADTSVSTVLRLLDRCHVSCAKVVAGVFPDETEEFVTSERFSFVHIDVDTYKSARDIMDYVWPKVTIGGIVVFDDYGFIRCDGITKLVNAYRDDQDKIVIHNLNGHGILIKISHKPLQLDHKSSSVHSNRELSGNRLDAIGIGTGTDKSSLQHDYLRHYEGILGTYKNRQIAVVEIGVLGGASLPVWEHLFPKAQIIGVDILERCRSYSRDRVEVEVGSQADPEFLDYLCAKWSPTIVIDDGSHQAEHVLFTLGHLFPRLPPDGCYIIEDLYLHSGEHSYKFRGAAPRSPIEYLLEIVQELTSSSASNFPSIQRNELVTLLDRIDFVRGAAFLHRKSPDLNEDLVRTRDLVALSRKARGWYFLAQRFAQMGMLEDAVMAARQAVELEPTGHEYHSRLAYLSRRFGDVSTAIAASQEAERLRGLAQRPR